MYKCAAKEEVTMYKAYCQNVLGRLVKRLEKEHAIRAYITLVGSGAEDMVTRNGKGPFDLDYNLILTSVPQKYEDSPRLLRCHVKEVLDGLVDGRFSHGKGSTSSIRYFAHPQDNRCKVVFSFDVAVIRKGDGKYKLVHEKGNDVFIWNPVPHSKELDKKIAAIRKCGCWDEVEEKYLRLKNMYLKRDNKHHPSFIVLAEAVNQVYQSIEH